MNGDEQPIEPTPKEQVLQFLDMRATNFRRTFHEGVDPQKTLQDLAKFCRANESTFHPDARISGQLDGRREVWLRIQDHLTLSPEQLYKKYGGQD